MTQRLRDALQDHYRDFFTTTPTSYRAREHKHR